MIPDVDEALRTLLEGALTSARVTFEPAAPEDVDVSGGPVVHLALRSALPVDTGRSGEPWAEVRDREGKVVGRQPPVRRFRLLYRVEACAANVGAAHAALGEVLLACVAHDVLPREVLSGALAEADAGVPLSVAPPAEDDHGVLLLEVIAPVRPPVVRALPTPVQELHLDATQVFAASGTESLELPPPGGPRRWSKVTVRERTTRPSDPRGA